MENTNHMYQFCIFPCSFFGYEREHVSWRELHGSRGLRNQVPRRIFMHRGEDVTGGWRNFHSEAVHHSYSGSLVEVGGIWDRSKALVLAFLSESCMEYDSLGNIDVDGCIILNCILKSEDVWTWTGLNWLRICPVSAFSFECGKWTFMFPKVGGHFSLGQQLLASQEGFCCMELSELLTVAWCQWFR